MSFVPGERLPTDYFCLFRATQGLLLCKLSHVEEAARQKPCMTNKSCLFCTVRPLLYFIRYYKPSVLLMCFFIPMSVPWYLWGESLWIAYFIPAVLRYTLVLNATWLVNSAAHMWGNRPYDQFINPRENKFVTFSAIGMKHTLVCLRFNKRREIKKE